MEHESDGKKPTTEARRGFLKTTAAIAAGAAVAAIGLLPDAEVFAQDKIGKGSAVKLNGALLLGKDGRYYDEAAVNEIIANVEGQIGIFASSKKWCIFKDLVCGCYNGGNLIVTVPPPGGTNSSAAKMVTSGGKEKNITAGKIQIMTFLSDDELAALAKKGVLNAEGLKAIRSAKK